MGNYKEYLDVCRVQIPWLNMGMEKTLAEGHPLNRAPPVTAVDGHSRFSVIQLDRRGWIVEANDRARRLLEQDEGLCDVDGVLSAATPRDHRVLQRLLAQGGAWAGHSPGRPAR